MRSLPKSVTHSLTRVNASSSPEPRLVPTPPSTAASSSRAPAPSTGPSSSKPISHPCHAMGPAELESQVRAWLRGLSGVRFVARRHGRLAGKVRTGQDSAVVGTPGSHRPADLPNTVVHLRRRAIRASVVEATPVLSGGQGADVVQDFVINDATGQVALACATVAASIVVVDAARGGPRVSSVDRPRDVTVCTSTWGRRSELFEIVRMAARPDRYVPPCLTRTGA
jgi:hypothetical protein